MNLIKKFCLPCIIVWLLIVSCNKEAIDLNNNVIETKEKTDHTSFKTDCRTGDLNRSVKEILKDEKDTENHKINMIMYHYGQAVMKMVRDNELLCYMTDAMLTKKNNLGISISELAKQDKNFKVKLNELLNNSISKNSIYPSKEPGITNLMKGSAWDSNVFLRENFTYEGEQYEPSIYFINSPEYCDASSKVNVLIGEEANECDDVVGWSNGQKIFMSEKEVLTSNAINIFVGVDEIESKKEPYSKHDLKNGVIGTTKVPTVPTDIDIDIDEFQIKSGHHYETSGTSEIRGWRLEYWPTNPPDTNPKDDFWEDFNPRDVDRDDIDDSTIFTTDRDAFDMSSSDFINGKFVFIGAYEWDWYTRRKRVFNPFSSNTFTDVWLRMKFSHEYYFKVADHLNYIFSDYWGNTTKTYSNNSCYFKLKRN